MLVVLVLEIRMRKLISLVICYLFFLSVFAKRPCRCARAAIALRPYTHTPAAERAGSCPAPHSARREGGARPGPSRHYYQDLGTLFGKALPDFEWDMLCMLHHRRGLTLPLPDPRSFNTARSAACSRWSYGAAWWSRNVPLFVARTLNATGQCRVTLSLR